MRRFVQGVSVGEQPFGRPWGWEQAPRSSRWLLMGRSEGRGRYDTSSYVRRCRR
eukprot:COSAG01_NODE_115_length_25561_cov_103.183450_13_plen_54_part_00